MILSPNNRTLYTEALAPPSGFILDTAIAATYSMDLTTLLSVPLQLVLQSTEDSAELMKDPIALYEALQRATKRVHVFAQQGQIKAPRQHHLLYSLLEPMITEVVAPAGGNFHPKMWLLRFVTEDGDNFTYRLLLPSKNLTTDRAWDVALTLDGKLANRVNANGAAIANFVEQLPNMAVNEFPLSREFNSLLAELPRVVWELPDGFDQLHFHLLGFGGRKWRPKKNKKLAVISPFIRPEALKVLAKTSDTPLAVISRSESLAELGGAAPFHSAYVLHDAAETEDGEDHNANSSEIGLHAKVYIYQIGNRTHIALGSANATNAALIADKNIEILAELAGPSYKVGNVESFLDPYVDAGLGQYLVPWILDENHEPDSSTQENKRLLEAARAALLTAGLTLSCSQEEESWPLDLTVSAPIVFEGVTSAVAWPVTVGSDRAVDFRPLVVGKKIRMPVQSIESLTSLIAFKLQAGGENLSFALNLPVTGMPEARERAILRSVVNNRDGFLRYLLLLLAGLGDGADVGTVARAFSGSDASQLASAFDDMPLLEELVRAFCREPKRLKKVRRLVNDISTDGDADNILPENFIGLWKVFEEAMEHHER
ncbi:MAG: hypothetical protein ACJAVI_005859 [Candidatus Azotimanducaceae bacterium]|jgi:hypothetical protein